MAQEVGVAYVTLLPSARGFGKAVEKELGGAASGHDKAQQSLWSNVVKYGAIAAGAIGALFTAKIIKGGLSRALNIEDAQAKLKGLGHDTESVTAIMTNALDAVRGTAFGLDSAATIAASAVAAGIKPGQELERYLRLTADAATIAGASLDEMGSILNKVEGSGKAYNDSLQQLADRGIPIYQWLADELGVTTDAVFKLASQGKISSEQFKNAIEKNIAGAALASGDTTRGAFANMQAAMSRWGASLVTEVLPHAKTLFGEMIIIFDGLNERSKPFAEGVGKWLGGLQIEGMGDRFLGWLDNLDMTEFSNLVTSLKPFGEVLKEIGPELVELAPSLKDLLEAIVPLAPKLVDLLQKAVPLVVELLDAIVPVVGWLADRITDTLELIPLLGEALGGEHDFFSYLDRLEQVGGIPATFAEWWRPVGEQVITTRDAVVGLVQGVRDAIGAVVDGIRDLWSGFGETLGDIGRVIVGTFLGDTDLVQEGISRMKDRLGGLFSDIRSNTTGAVDGMWAAVRAKFAEGVAYVQTLPEKLSKFFESLPSKLESIGRMMIEGLIRGITAMGAKAVESVTGLASRMVSGAKDWLDIRSPSRVFRDEIGKQIGAGLIAGVDSMRVDVDESVRALVSVPDVQVPQAAESSRTLNLNGVDPWAVLQLMKQELGGQLAVMG